MFDNLPIWYCHDSSAAIIKDGKLLSCIEQERVDRVKHSSNFPLEAISECLKISKILPSQIDKVCYYFEESHTDIGLGFQYLTHNSAKVENSRKLISSILEIELSIHIPPSEIEYVAHHFTHAVMAAFQSGFQEALVVVIDGEGENESVSIYDFSDDSKLELLHTESIYNSLGNFYLDSIKLLGYTLFDEYKVMGLAPYGKESKFNKLFDDLVELKEDGKYIIKAANITAYFLQNGVEPIRDGEQMSREHMDFAFALQKKTEEILIHILSHWKSKTNHKNLAMAGGVALNCSMNGSIAKLNIFENMFVHPASHDGGTSIGAALSHFYNDGSLKSERIKSVSLGTEIEEQQVSSLTERNSNVVEVIGTGKGAYKKLAQFLAEGAIVGFAQGKMEFGPRALGARSILADPRNKENKDKVNSIIKLRESYRPFAPMVLETEVRNWFEIPDTNCNLDFMVFKIPVLKDKIDSLKATTHVDGSARVQVVKNESDGISLLLQEFFKITGVPVLLNTSFNVNAEPIVASAEDALQCFLLSGLDYLLLGDKLLAKKVSHEKLLKTCVISLNPKSTLNQKFSQGKSVFFVELNSHYKYISESTFEIVKKLNGNHSLDSLLTSHSKFKFCLESILSELKILLSTRMLNINLG